MIIKQNVNKKFKMIKMGFLYTLPTFYRKLLNKIKKRVKDVIIIKYLKSRRVGTVKEE